jgi:hypothetical protein
MGRTNPTFRDALRIVEDRWTDYRRALRRRDQPRFDQLFDYARDHADAGGLLNHDSPIIPALFSICLEQEAQIEALEQRVDTLEAHIDNQEEQACCHEAE